MGNVSIVLAFKSLNLHHTVVIRKIPLVIAFSAVGNSLHYVWVWLVSSVPTRKWSLAWGNALVAIYLLGTTEGLVPNI